MNQQDELLRRHLGDYPQAVELIEQLAVISQTWDDLIDNDNPVLAADVNHSFASALLLSSNDFFMQFQQEMLSQIAIAINTWMEANVHEVNGELPRMTYVSRSALTPLIKRIGYLALGPERGLHFALEVNRAVFDEPYEQYLDGLRKETKEAGEGSSIGSGEGANAPVPDPVDQLPAALRSV